MAFFPETFIVPRLLVILLATVRLSPLMLAVPAFAPTQLPTSIRVVLALMLAAALASGLQWHHGGAVDSLPDLTGLFEAVLSELVLGLLMSLGVLVAFAATSIAGRVVDVQIGFGLGQVLDETLDSFKRLSRDSGS